MRPLIALLIAIATAMMVVFSFTRTVFAWTFSALAVPEPRARGPTWFSALKTFADNLTTAAFYMFGAAQNETLQVVASMRSYSTGHRDYDLNRSHSRDPTDINLSADVAANGLLHSVTFLLGVCKTALGRVALNPS